MHVMQMVCPIYQRKTKYFLHHVKSLFIVRDEINVGVMELELCWVSFLSAHRRSWP